MNISSFTSVCPSVCDNFCHPTTSSIYKEEKKVFSDEVGAALNFFDGTITPILSDRMNIKVTKKEDLVLVEQYLKLSGRL